MGTELMFVQMGSEPGNWKPMNDIGAGVKEIRVKIAGNAYRTIYIATLADAIYVLHCFQKKTQKNAKAGHGVSKETTIGDTTKARLNRERREIIEMRGY